MYYLSALSYMRDERKSRALVLFLVLILFFEPLSVLSLSAQERHKPRHKPSGEAQQDLTDDQRIRHMLARLSFGARPGDFERVKAMGGTCHITR
jgi:hypothetical protein